MKNHFFTLVLFLMFSSFSLAQNVTDLEEEISFNNHGNGFEKVAYARKLLLQDPFNEKGINYMIRYYNEMKYDSISIFLTQFKNKFPDNPKTYIILSEYWPAKKDIKQTQINFLEKSISIDPKNIEAHKLLAKIYYDDFQIPYLKPEPYESLVSNKNEDSIFKAEYDKIWSRPINSTFKNSPEKAYEYLTKLWNLNKSEQSIYYFPIKQLESFLKIKSSQYQLPNNSFFPSGHFIKLEKDWQNDYSKNYLFEAEKSESTTKWISKQLLSLQEHDLMNQKLNSQDTIIRLTWLRSFHNPITIKITRSNSRIILNYVIGNGAGGYEPKGIKRKGKIRINEKEWNEIQKLLYDANYYNLENDFYVLMTDGSEWIIEIKTENKFYAKKRNWPNEKFLSICNYILELSEIKIPKKERY